ncbi:MAG: sigma-54-dependent Fis family transcriptional regulator, partial [Pirellulales bacterium]|nr:sigma-54-dependent Fis family transcriptional regulator [Pirellulales bacterium]
ERAAILGNGHRLEIAKALGQADPSVSRLAESHPQNSSHNISRTPAEELISLDTAMARHIQAALTHTRGRIEGPTGAARILEINPHTLRARMRKLGIDWKNYRE